MCHSMYIKFMKREMLGLTYWTSYMLNLFVWIDSILVGKIGNAITTYDSIAIMLGSCTL